MGLLDRIEEKRQRFNRWLVYGEDILYYVTGALLGITALYLLWGTGGMFVEGIREGTLIGRSLDILDALLLVLVLVELMHTIRVSLETHSLEPEPFLIVALIAGVRRVLKAGEGGEGGRGALRGRAQASVNAVNKKTP